MGRSAKQYLPMCFGVVLLLTSSGCIYLPSGEYEYNGLDLRKTFGVEISGASLRIGTATRGDVVAQLAEHQRYLGPPPATPVWVLSDSNCRGLMLSFGPPPAGPLETRVYVARLEFDERDVLMSYEVRRETEWSFAGAGMNVSPTMWVSPEHWPEIAARTELVSREPSAPPPRSR